MSESKSKIDIRVVANDSLPLKPPIALAPQMKVQGGVVPKTPITTGTGKK